MDPIAAVEHATVAQLETPGMDASNGHHHCHLGDVITAIIGMRLLATVHRLSRVHIVHWK